MAYKVELTKGKNNMIGISIGGGAPFCPSLYVVQVFHRTPAADDGSLCPGDELVEVNGTNLQGLTRRETAKLIQETKVCSWGRQSGCQLVVHLVWSHRP